VARHEDFTPFDRPAASLETRRRRSTVIDGDDILISLDCLAGAIGDDGIANRPTPDAWNVRPQLDREPR